MEFQDEPNFVGYEEEKMAIVRSRTYQIIKKLKSLSQLFCCQCYLPNMVYSFSTPGCASTNQGLEKNYTPLRAKENLNYSIKYLNKKNLHRFIH